MTDNTQTAPIWVPDEERQTTARLTAFWSLARERTGLVLPDYASLYRWSVDAPAEFWPLVWEFTGILAGSQWDQALVDGEAMPGARWFVGSRLNYAQNLLRPRPEGPALMYFCENGERVTLGYGELTAQVAAVADWLRAMGVAAGDRIAAFMPNRPETIVTMLAAASIGAVWSSASPDFGAAGVLERFGQIEPRVLLTTDGYFYNGKRVDMRDKIRTLVAGMPSLERILIVPWLESAPSDFRDISETYADVVANHSGAPLVFEQLPFDHPLLILYSSGTTGRPKCIVHGAGGTLIQHLKELVLHTDLRPGDRLFYFTTCGWMMWNWLVSGLAAEATLVLYDGSPFRPKPRALLDMAEQARVDVFGTSAKYIAALDKAGVEAPASGIRTMLSTGSPLAPESYDYVRRAFGSDVQLASISGGTDIVSCFALGNPLLPVYRGELQCRGLGMAVDVFDNEGRSLVGERGELVCIRPFPSMPLGFWRDDDGSRYRAAYFERFPGVWTHGDFAELTPRGGLVIHGRSDAVLNPGGVRIGTAEIYRVVESMDEVVESIAVGQDWQGDQRIVLFVVLRDGLELDGDLTSRIKQRIRSNLSPRHVPKRIFQMPAIPRTRNGKIVELAVREIVHGRPVVNIEALANPEVLELYRDLPGLRDE